MSSRPFSPFSSDRFKVSGLMLKYLINLELTFVQDGKYGSVFFLLHAAIQSDVASC